MKMNLTLTIVFALLTIMFTLMSVLSFKKLEIVNAELFGSDGSNPKLAQVPLEKTLLDPKRQELANLTKDLDHVREDYYQTHREKLILEHKLLVFKLSRENAIYHHMKWKRESETYADNRKNTEESKRQEIARYEAMITRLNEVIARDNKSFEDKKNVIKDQRKVLADKIPVLDDTMNREKNFKETQIARAREDLRQYALKTARSYKNPPNNGTILSTDPILNTAVIGLGKKDGIKRGMKFDIFNVNKMNDLFIKAQFRVNDISETTATGFILELTDYTQPVIEGDFIGNPLFVRYQEAILTGEIIDEKYNANQILINRGSHHSVKVGQEFEIFKENAGTERIVKATAKVLTVDANTSVCELKNINIKEIFKEDKVATPIDYNSIQTFYLAGSFRKKYSKEKISEKIIGFGHIVTEELKPTNTFIVAGTEEADEDIKRARELNITVMQEDDLLKYIE